MRTNMPVTNNEVMLTERSMIVSKTDTKGFLTYINKDFLDISGFTEAELIGQPHNIVRHPDMPAEAFADLWNYLQQGKPWTGFVKNRCKNGDYYWVLANASPIVENGQVIGYMSVRTMPTRAQVAAVGEAYRMFKEGRAQGLKIENGKVVKDTLLGRLNVFKNITIKNRLATVIGILAVLLLMIGGLGLVGMNKTDEALKTVYENRMKPVRDLAQISNLMLDNRARVLDAVSEVDIVTDGKQPPKLAIKKDIAASNADSIGKNKETITKLWDGFMATDLTPEEKKLAEKYSESRGRYVNEGLKPAVEAIKSGNYAEAKRLSDVIETLYQATSKDMDALMKLQFDVADQEFKSSVQRYETSRNISIVLISIGLLLAIWLGRSLIIAILRPLEHAIDIFGQITQGNYANEVKIQHEDEIGKVLNALRTMQIRLGFDLAEATRVANENLRIKIALDNVSTGAMIADTARNIIYVNKAVVAMLTGAEADIRKQLPNFSASKLVGTNIDTFHKNPAHQQQLLSTLTSPYVATINIGGRVLRVTANPVINDQGERLGAVAEWVDRTTEVAVEQEVASLVEAAVMGDFSKRIELQGKEGFFLTLGEGMNKLMDTSETGLNEVVRVLGALSKGDLTETITNEYFGTFGQLKDDSNQTVESLKTLIGEIKTAVDSISTASKQIAAGNTDLSQRTEEQASSLEETASSMEELSSTVKQNAENAKQANQLAAAASTVAVKGGSVVGEVVTTMASINESSRKIVDIISVIDGIAFQTNILALNAAVEAARAGEQGRGFAVVASEVRNLAQRSAAAAKEIKELISNSVEKVEDGTKQVEAAGQTMEEIVTSVKRVTDIMAEIAAASAEQSSGIEQVNQAITQMDEVTQQNAALVEEAAAAAESLEEQSNGLAESVSVFKLDESGVSGGRRAARAAIAAPARTPALAKPSGGASRPAAPAKRVPKPPKAGDDGEEWEEF